MKIYEDENNYGDSDYCDCSLERKFITKEEKINWLRKYKEYLERETQGVIEAIEKIESNK